jgi:hypothetical protein
MKSVIHEASSITKAIEQGWVKAGKPKDFNVKILQEAQKNFFGFVVKNAKVGIFVEERSLSSRDNQGQQKKHGPQRRKPAPRRNDGQWRGRRQEFGSEHNEQGRPFDREKRDSGHRYDQERKPFDRGPERRAEHRNPEQRSHSSANSPTPQPPLDNLKDSSKKDLE